MWFFTRNKKIDATDAIALTDKEYRVIVDLNVSDPKVRAIVDKKGIPIAKGKVKVIVGEEIFFITTEVEKFGTKLLD